MILQWREFNIDLLAVDTKMRADYPTKYSGNQASSFLELYFSEEPTEEEKAAIQSYWDGLTDQSAEVLSYRTQASIKEAIDNLKMGLVNKTWDQMTVTERKIVVGATIDKSEL